MSSYVKRLFNKGKDVVAGQDPESMSRTIFETVPQYSEMALRFLGMNTGGNVRPPNVPPHAEYYPEYGLWSTADVQWDRNGNVVQDIRGKSGYNNGGDVPPPISAPPRTYEDRIINMGLREKMQRDKDYMQSMGYGVSHNYLDPNSAEWKRIQGHYRKGGAIGENSPGNWYAEVEHFPGEDRLPEGKGINVPFTPTLANYSTMQEEMAHALYPNYQHWNESMPYNMHDLSGIDQLKEEERAKHMGNRFAYHSPESQSIADASRQSYRDYVDKNYMRGRNVYGFLQNKLDSGEELNEAEKNILENLSQNKQYFEGLPQESIKKVIKDSQELADKQYEKEKARREKFYSNYNTGGAPMRDLNDPSNRDTIPAMLTEGEYVLNKEATQMFKPYIEAMNKAGLQQRQSENRMVQRNMGGPLMLNEGDEVSTIKKIWDWAKFKAGSPPPGIKEGTEFGVGGIFGYGKKMLVFKNGEWYDKNSGKPAGQSLQHQANQEYSADLEDALSSGDQAMLNELGFDRQEFDRVNQQQQQAAQEAQTQNLYNQGIQNMNQAIVDSQQAQNLANEVSSVKDNLVDTGETLGFGASTSKLLFNPERGTYYRQRNDGEIVPVGDKANYGNLASKIQNFEDRTGIRGGLTKRRIDQDTPIRETGNPEIDWQSMQADTTSMRNQGATELQIQNFLESAYPDTAGHSNWATDEGDAEIQELINQAEVPRPTAPPPEIVDQVVEAPSKPTYDDEDYIPLPLTPIPDVTSSASPVEYDDAEEAIEVTPGTRAYGASQQIVPANTDAVAVDPMDYLPVPKKPTGSGGRGGKRDRNAHVPTQIVPADSSAVAVDPMDYLPVPKEPTGSGGRGGKRDRNAHVPTQIVPSNADAVAVDPLDYMPVRGSASGGGGRGRSGAKLRTDRAHQAAVLKANSAGDERKSALQNLIADRQAEAAQHQAVMHANARGAQHKADLADQIRTAQESAYIPPPPKEVVPSPVPEVPAPPLPRPQDATKYVTNTAGEEVVRDTRGKKVVAGFGRPGIIDRRYPKGTVMRNPRTGQVWVNGGGKLPAGYGG